MPRPCSLSYLKADIVEIIPTAEGVAKGLYAPEEVVPGHVNT